MDSRKKTGEISGMYFADQYGFTAFYSFTCLYPAIRKKWPDHKRNSWAFRQSIRMGRCCRYADVIFFIAECTDDHRNAAKNGYVACKSLL